MSLVTTPRFTPGQNLWLSRSTSAVLPLPTGPAMPTRNALVIAPPSASSTLRRLLLEQEIPLRQRQNLRRLAGEQFAVRAHFVGLRIDFDLLHGGIVNHVALADGSAILHRHSAFGEFLSNSR